MKIRYVLCFILLSSSAVAAQLSVTSFGAVPDDGSDDTAAIKAAITASNGGDTVYFPAGEYIITDIIEPKSWTTFRGESRDTVTIKFGGGSKSFMLKPGYRNNVTISDLTLDGNHDPGLGSGIELSNSSNMVVRNIRIQNLGVVGSAFSGMGIAAYSNMKNAIIADNIFINMAPGSQWGAAIFADSGSDGNLIENNTVTTTGRAGIVVHESVNNIIRNNTISGVGQYWADTDGSFGAVALGIELHSGANNTLIENNTMDHWLSIDQSSGCAIRNNTVSDGSGRIKAIGLEHAGGSDNVFTGNTVEDGAQIGISISKNPAKDRTLWARNRIVRSNTWGAQIQGDTGGASQHYFYKNEFLDTSRRTSHVLLPDYPLSPTDFYGFRFNGNADNITLDQNVISDSESGGIFFGGSIESLSFVDNTITDNGGPSVNADPSSTNLEWSGNTVTGNSPNTQLSSRGFSNQRPSASFTSSDTIYAGVETTFTSTSTDPDGTIAEYLWDLGAGLPSTVGSPTCTYDEPGEYVVYLVVWDDEGRGHIAEKTIEVILPPLAIEGTGGAGSVRVRWPKAATGYELEYSTTLEAESWAPESTSPVENGENLEVDLALGGTHTFYRLNNE